MIRDPYMYRLVMQEFDIYSYFSAHATYKPLTAEVDEQGTYYGYKVLVWSDSHFISPVMEAHWDLQGFICADGVPNEENKKGIHCLKVPFHNEILGYYYHVCNKNIEQPCIVKCALSGTIVEGEIGFRAQQAQIISVFSCGEWFTYENYLHKTGSRDFSRREYIPMG